MMRLRRRDEGISMVLVIVLVVFTLIITVGAAVFWANYKDAERRAALIRREMDRQDSEIAVITAQLAKVNEATGLPLGEEGRLSAPRANEAMKKVREEYVSPAAYEKYPLVPPQAGDGRLKKEDADKLIRARDESAYLRTLQALVNPAISRTNHYKNRMEQLMVDLGSAESQKK
ncbi:MAG TPA: hypothetical protein VKW04_04795, partial [Planctomycetota bacterium]|nr:hypothetical protein [Planctomycetota bacterium]